MADHETHWRKVSQPKYSRRQTEPNLGQYQARVLVDSRLRDDMQQPLPIEDLLLNYNPQNLMVPSSAKHRSVRTTDHYIASPQHLP